MEQYYIDALYLVGCAIHNKKAILRPDMDIARVIRECYGQSCELLALSAIVSAEGSDAVENLSDMKTYLIKRRVKETVRSLNVNKLLGDLEAAGHRPVVIKGAVLADLYPDPALRESVDTDLFFVHTEDCDAAEAYLLEHGGTVKGLKDTEKHSAVEYAGVGMVELHRNLYDEDFRKLCLKNEEIICQPLERIVLRGGQPVETLGKTDALKYIFCHMIQHFLFSRCDLKQICDILLYTRRNRDEIDAGELRRFLEKTGCLRAFDTVVGAGIEYLGFKAEELLPVEYSPETVELFLADCFNGCTKGVWGEKAIPRGTGVFSSELYGERGGIIKRIARGFFPKKRMLVDLYPYCEKNPLLLPAAWANNIFDLAKGVMANRGKYGDREPLLKRMDLI